MLLQGEFDLDPFSLIFDPPFFGISTYFSLQVEFRTILSTSKDLQFSVEVSDFVILSFLRIKILYVLFICSYICMMYSMDLYYLILAKRIGILYSMWMFIW